MITSGQGIRLKIYLDENNTVKGKSLYELIVLKARELNLNGATVSRGIMGFGAHTDIHSAKILRLSEDLPVIIELVDKEENIRKIMPYLEEMIDEGLVTTEQVKMRIFRKD